MPDKTPTEFSTAMTESVYTKLTEHLLARLPDEDLCFAIWFPSTGHLRKTALVGRVLLPEEGDRFLHGNASFSSGYFERALRLAGEAGGGLAFLHSHPYPGWQAMSPDDHHAESGHAGAVAAATGLPLVGLTIGSDGTLSARFWHRTSPRNYEAKWCSTVRVVGKGLSVSRAIRHMEPREKNPRITRTVSVWGEKKHAELTALRVGIIGLGSVGSIVAECLARMGFEKLILIDHDIVEEVNLDRVLGATVNDVRERTPKVQVSKRLVDASHTARDFSAEPHQKKVTSEGGYRVALDCDVLFSCVDRPWPRRVLNQLAYGHLIPVVDGGFVARFREGTFLNANWSVQTVAPTRPCLECLETYDPGMVAVEQQGYLDDPHYIEGLPDDHELRRNENVIVFSAPIASLEILQLVAMVTGLKRMYEVGSQRYQYYPGTMDVTQKACSEGCPYVALVGLGDFGDSSTGRFTEDEQNVQGGGDQ